MALVGPDRKLYGVTGRIVTPKYADVEDKLDMCPLNEHSETPANFFLPTSVSVGDIEDCHNRQCKVVYTVTGQKRKLKPEGPTGKRVQVNGKELSIFKYKDRLFASDAKCPHNGGPLDEGSVQENEWGQVTVKCPWHHWQFDLEDGQNTNPTVKLPGVSVYAVQEDDDGRLSVGFQEMDSSTFAQAPDF